MENPNKDINKEEENIAQLLLLNIFADLIQSSTNEELKIYFNNIQNKTEWMNKYEKYLDDIDYFNSNISAVEVLSKYTGILVTKDDFRSGIKSGDAQILKSLRMLESIIEKTNNK